MIRQFFIYFCALSVMHVTMNTVQAQQNVSISLEEMPVVEIPPRPPKDSTLFNEMQYWLNKKDQAPFSGIIVNPEGWSYILTEHQSLQLRSVEALSLQRKKDHALVKLKIDELHIKIEALKKSHKIQLDARNEDLKSSQKLNKSIIKKFKKQNRRNAFLYGTVGIGAGIVLTILLQALAF